MYQLTTISLCISLLIFNSAKAQDFKNLEPLKAPTLEVYYSPGQKARATAIANKANDANRYYQELLQFKPTVNLLVLAPGDWQQFAAIVLYGMPHFKNDKTLIVASTNNPFWKSFLPPLDQLPVPLRTQVEKTYADSGGLSMQPFFDLLALHELGHAYHLQAKVEMQRHWMSELFVNILLHTYIAEKDTASLMPLTLFPQMVIGSSTEKFEYTSLQSLDEHYYGMPKINPKNYGWYQCRLHAGAAKIYERDGKLAAMKLWNALKSTSTRLDDTSLLQLLERNGVPSVADFIRNWDRNIPQ